MPPQLPKPSYELWQTITTTYRRFAVGDLKTLVDGMYYEVLVDARKKARHTANGIVIAAFHKGQWYEIDIAYSDEDHAD